MTTELICHLGDFRTGSTAIQSVLRGQAGRFGLFWPEGATHVALAQSLGDPGARDHHWQALARAMEGQPRTVISAEHFEFADPADLVRALETHLPDVSVRLVAYVRPHGPALLARYAESVKIGNFEGTPGDYLDWPQTGWRLSYAARFGRWRAAFGDRFSLVLYDRSAFPGGSVVRDFLSRVTGTDPGEVPVPQGNPTPGLADLALARAFHHAVGDLPEAARPARWTMGRHLGRLMAALPRPDIPLVADRALAVRIAERFAADARALDAEFFAPATPMADALDRLRREAPELPQSFDPADHLSEDALRLAALWGQMIGDGLRRPGGAEMLNGLYHE
jgi:hypothetical protein